MRNLVTTVSAAVVILFQAIAPVVPNLVAAATQAQPAEAAGTSNYTLTLNTKSSDALNLQPKHGSFDSDVLTPLRAAQEAKAKADADAAAKKAADDAAAAAAAAQAATAKVAAQVSIPTLTGGDAEYKLFIYNHESGNNPTRTNGSGCLGLGQACPGSKLLAVCPTMDYACEDAWFTNYAISRYGSWANAYAYWIVHRNW